ncbi:MAG TPA: undecaprenyl-diphosphate phosphatase [Candidatus Omnitrophica bacterium]|nr:undecaprenyl-diphosphate phosphatase [Candidatus Omnitrophota bacterium]
MLTDAFILGIVQGIAEWLPISSSGHLVLAQHFFNLEGGISFDVFLHLSSLTVIVIFFRNDILHVAKALITSDTKSYEFKFAIYVVSASVVTVIVGLILKNWESLLTNLNVVGLSFLFTTVLLFLSRRETYEKLDLKKAIFVGFMQGVALLPGVSRSGSTIAGAKIVGVNDKDAFRFSFLILLPAIVGAIILKFEKIALLPPRFLLVGFSTSLVLSFISLTLLKKVVLKNRLHYFGYYCLFLSILTFSLSLLQF